MTNLFCNTPNLIKCLDPRCWLSTPCKFVDKCMQRIINDNILYYQCACDHSENGVQVYMTPDCVTETVNCQPTFSPTLSPSYSPTLSPSYSPTLFPSYSPTSYPSLFPTSSPTPFVTELPVGSSDDFDYNILYYSGGGLFVLIVLLIYFRKKIKDCCCNNNRVIDEEEDVEQNSRDDLYRNCVNEFKNN